MTVKKCCRNLKIKDNKSTTEHIQEDNQADKKTRRLLNSLTALAQLSFIAHLGF